MSFFEKIGSFLRRYKSIRVVILCVFAATTFWFFNALNETYSANIRYPITFSYNQDDFVVMEDLPEEVYLNLEGIGWNLFRKSLGIKVTPLRIYLENPAEVRAISGSSLPAIISDQLDEFNLNFVLTDSLFLNIDRKVKKDYVVKIDSANINLAENHVITSNVISFPDSVHLIGPQSILERVGDSLILSIPANNVSSDYNEEVPITFTRDELIIKDPPFVNVSFDVSELIDSEVQIVVDTENFPSNLALTDSVVSINLKVLIHESDLINPADISVIADYRNLNPEDSTIIPFLGFTPEYIYDIEVDTTALRVNLIKD